MQVVCLLSTLVDSIGLRGTMLGGNAEIDRLGATGQAAVPDRPRFVASISPPDYHYVGDCGIDFPNLTG